MVAPRSLLEALEPLITRERGARFEGDVMCLLQRHWFVVRSFEFAAVDGGLVLDGEMASLPSGTSFAERYTFYRQLLRANPDSVQLIPFDVKSSAGRVGSTQNYYKTVKQHGEAAFFIGISAADPNYVEVIPNNPIATLPETDRPGREIVVNQTHKTSLDADTSAYGSLNPCGSPHRMPLGYLPDAIARVRQCAITGETYVNPWTKVRFLGWRPLVVRSMESMAPAASTEHYTGYLGIMRIWRHLQNARTLRSIPIYLDFVGLQPRLADLKLILGQRQVLVQYKIDAVDRAWGNFSNVAIARDGKPFFSSYDRYDFLFQQFSSVSRRPNTATAQAFFFLPERLLPASFYTAVVTAGEYRLANFSGQGFDDYLVEMDDAGDWVQRVVDIIIAEPRPRRAGPIPFRLSEFEKPVADGCRSQLRELFASFAVTPPPAAVSKPATYQQELSVFRRTLFRVIMEQCFQRASGLLVLLADEHPDGDFAFCSYKWSRRDREIYSSSGRPPRAFHQLPASTPVVTLYAFARTVPCTSRGPLLSAAEFRRINSSSHPRLLVFDPMGPEGRDTLGTLLVVPTEDLSVDWEQRRRYKKSLAKDHHRGQYAERSPLLARMLHAGHAITDYAMSGSGLTAYDGTDWAQLWELLVGLTGTSALAFPRDSRRQPALYRSSVQRLNLRLLGEITRPGAQTGSAAGGPNVGSGY